MSTNDIIIVTLHYFGWQVMPEYHWNHWIDPIVFPYILPITQIALTGDVVNDIDIYQVSGIFTNRDKYSLQWTRVAQLVAAWQPGWEKMERE